MYCVFIELISLSFWDLQIDCIYSICCMALGVWLRWGTKENLYYLKHVHSGHMNPYHIYNIYDLIHCIYN